MRIVRNVVNEAWILMPPAVTEYTGYKGFTSTRTGQPTKIVVQRLLPRILKDVHAHLESGRAGEHFSYSWRSEAKAEVSDRMADAIIARMKEQAPLVAATAEWHRRLMAAYPTWSRGFEAPPFPKDNEHDRLVDPSLVLAGEHGAPDEATAAEICQSKLTTLKQSAWSGITASLAANEARWLDALDDVWAQGVAASAQEHGPDGEQKAAERLRQQEFESTLDEFFLAAFSAQGAKWRSQSDERRRAVASFERLVTACASELPPELPPSASSASRGYLRLVAAPARPALRGSDGDDSSLLVIPSTIEERLSRIFASLEKKPGIQSLDGTRVRLCVPSASAAEVVIRTIRASGRPFALISPAARTIVLTMLRATTTVGSGMRNTPAHLTPAPETSTGAADAHFRSEWHTKAVSPYLRSARPGSSLREYLQHPHPDFLSRAWVRAGAQDLGETDDRAPDARMVWEHVTGAFNSVVTNMPTVAQRLERQDRGPRDLAGHLPMSYDEYEGAIRERLELEPSRSFGPADGPASDRDELEPDWESPAWTRVDRAYGEMLAAIVSRRGEAEVQEFWTAAESGDEETFVPLWAEWESAGSAVPADAPSVDMVVSTWISRLTPLRRATLPDLLDFALGRGKGPHTAVRATVQSLATARRPPTGEETAAWWRLRTSFVEAKGLSPDQGEFWRWIHALPSLAEAAGLVANAVARRRPGSE